MNHMTRIAAALISVIGGPLLTFTPPSAAALAPSEVSRGCAGLTIDVTCVVPGVAARPIVINFDTSAVDPSDPEVWVGTVDGALTGTLETRLTERRVTGAVWHVRFTWIISADDRSFVAKLRGTLNIETGAVVMRGSVVDGYLRGARVHEDGQLVDAAQLRFQGSLELLPATTRHRR